MRRCKPPQLEGIPPNAIKQVAGILPKWSLKVLNSLLKNQKLLEKWKVVKVILIPKGTNMYVKRFKLATGFPVQKSSSRKVRSEGRFALG